MVDAAVEQGGVAGENMAGRESTYAGGVWQNSLDMFGLSVVTLGQDHSTTKTAKTKVLLSPGLKQGRGVRLVFTGERLIGATLLGDTRNVRHYRRLIAERIPAWDCLQRKLAPASKAAKSPALPEAERLMRQPGNQLMQYNLEGTRQRMGDAFGRSVVPQRPAR